MQYNASKGKGQLQKAGTLEISVIEDPIYDLVLVAQNLLYSILYYTIVQIADVFPILLGTSHVGTFSGRRSTLHTVQWIIYSSITFRYFKRAQCRCVNFFILDGYK